MKEFLKYFINKVCTVTTLQINFRFKEEQMMDYFMGIVESIDDHGITLTHLITKNKSYIFFPYIVSINEEQYFQEDDPEYNKVIDDYRREKPLSAAKTTTGESSKFINPNALAEMAKKAKNG